MEKRRFASFYDGYEDVHQEFKDFLYQFVEISEVLECDANKYGSGSSSTSEGDIKPGSPTDTSGATGSTSPDSGKPDGDKPAHDKPKGETPQTETPVEDDTLPIFSIDGKARTVALADIDCQYDAILKLNPEAANKAKSVTKAFATFDQEAMTFIQAMEKLPASSSKRQVLLGQLKTLAAKLYDQLSILNEILPNTQENAADPEIAAESETSDSPCQSSMD
ncbi:MAG: hypothetical protein H7318_20870 [Oligoflexus sp.]|nr:hypothetical protein [Oligoflexus sp.]